MIGAKSRSLPTIRMARQGGPFMRLSADQIRRGIQHPEWEVRDTALAYFKESFSTDAAVMPRLVEAVGQYGWAEACSPYTLCRFLEQSEATVRWLFEQLQLPCPDLDRERLWTWWMRFLSWTLHGEPGELLIPTSKTSKPWRRSTRSAKKASSGASRSPLWTRKRAGASWKAFAIKVPRTTTRSTSPTRIFTALSR